MCSKHLALTLDDRANDMLRWMADCRGAGVVQRTAPQGRGRSSRSSGSGPLFRASANATADTGSLRHCRRAAIGCHSSASSPWAGLSQRSNIASRLSDRPRPARHSRCAHAQYKGLSLDRPAHRLLFDAADLEGQLRQLSLSRLCCSGPGFAESAGLVAAADLAA
jgi:hypothetical protein